MTDLELFEREISGDRHAHEQLFFKWQPCVYRVVKSMHAKYGLADLLQEGNAALWESLLQFDPARGVSFKTFYYGRIRYALLNWINFKSYKGGSSAKGR